MRLLRFFLLFLILPASAADRVSVSLTFTNATADGDTFVLNGVTRTWKTTVTSPSIQISNNASYLSSKTNFYNQVALNPFASATMLNAGASNVTLVGASGVSMLATVSGTWGFVTYSTQTVATLTAVRVPVSGEPTAAVRTNIGSGLVAAIEDYSTNSLNQNSTAASELVGLTNTQGIVGAKSFTNIASHFIGGALYGTNITGTIGKLTNGVLYSSVLVSPSITNGANYGNAFRSPGSGDSSEQFGYGALASGQSSMAIGVSAIANQSGATAIGLLSYASAPSTIALGQESEATAEAATAIGNNAVASGTNSVALGQSTEASYEYSSAIGVSSVSTQPHQIRLGTASEFVSIPGGLRVEGGITNSTLRGTNVFPAGSDISFGRYALSTLANGANSIAVGTNVFIQVSGPSGAFTINGIDGQPNRDGKLLIVLNYTGQNMTIAHDSGTEPTAANRIYTMTGADVSTTANGSAILIYSASASRWVCINLEQ